MCIGMCIDMCMDMCIVRLVRSVYRLAHRPVYGHVYASVHLAQPAPRGDVRVEWWKVVQADGHGGREGEPVSKRKDVSTKRLASVKTW